MRAMDAPEQAIAAVQARIDQAAPPDEQQAFGVYLENWDSVQTFLDVRTQWQYAGMGQRAGLNFAGVDAWIVRHHRRRRWRALLDDVALMEKAVLVADQELMQEKE